MLAIYPRSMGMLCKKEVPSSLLFRVMRLAWVLFYCGNYACVFQQKCRIQYYTTCFLKINYFDAYKIFKKNPLKIELYDVIPISWFSWMKLFNAAFYQIKWYFLWRSCFQLFSLWYACKCTKTSIYSLTPVFNEFFNRITST